MRIISSIVIAILQASLFATFSKAATVETERLYLSGHGCDDMRQWDFFCTDGRNSGKWTKIGVPSCWELQGFGTYQYGMKFYGKEKPEGIANETGKYKYEFTIPESWAGKQILLCFEASMTDTYCEINGRKAGSKHKGGFTPFFYDVSDRIFFGKKKNRIEVTVDKESEEGAVNMAERRADYWNFGGIIRPVFLIAKPAHNIERVAIDARHDGLFTAEAYLNHALQNCFIKIDIIDIKTRKSVASAIENVNGDKARFSFKVEGIKPWSAETPNRYEAVFTLTDSKDAADPKGNGDSKSASAKSSILHIERQKFGFRTIEVREHDGVYVNNQKMLFRGVNRHSFRPETGRTLSYAKNLEDVLLMRSMNMNAVRLSHYPADPEFLDICDSLGMYVLDEHPGWHWYHNTINGTKLVEAMVKRDQNHPSVIFWDNGNEGGFNMELDPVFHEFDLQKRVVLYPWANLHGMETKHYRSWGETQALLREPEITMPTEFLHGLYDGGHGAGLYDYWEMMRKAPRCAGGFLWDLQDEGVMRTDMDGFIDNVGNYGADGIVGPHFEKEGSYFTIKQLWSPIQVKKSCNHNATAEGLSQNATANGQANAITEGQSGTVFVVENRFDFINLQSCRFRYEYKQLPAAGNKKVTVTSKGTINGPDVAPHAEGTITIPSGKGDVLEITAIDDRGEDLFTWSFHDIPSSIASAEKTPVMANKANVAVTEDDRTLTVNNQSTLYTFDKKSGMLCGVQVPGAKGQGSKIQGSNGMATFAFQGPQFIAAKRADRSQDGFYNHDDKEAEKKKTQYSTYADQGKLQSLTVAPNCVTATYSHGSLEKVVWTFVNDGSVRMDYEYTFGGVVDEMGIMFDYPEQKVKSKQWVGDGPYRVWQNRLHGPQYGYWANDYNDPVPGESFEYPEFKGYFANVAWMELTTEDGCILIEPTSSFTNDTPNNDRNIGVYTPRDGRDHILYTLPETGISIMKVIPPVRNKVNTTDLNGPSAQPFWADGSKYSGTVQFTFKAASVK